MSKLASKQFWTAAVERAVKTVAQVAVAFIGTGLVGLFEVDWLRLASISLVAGLVSVLTSVASIDSAGEVKPLKAG